MVHLFVVYGYQGAEEEAEKLRLTDRLLQAVLAEAQMVCVGQPMLIAGDLNADLAVIPCLSKDISSGKFVDLALAFSLGAGLTPDIICTFNRDDGTGSRRDFFVGCSGALAASQACYVTDRWFTPHFSVLARFRIGAWMADVACPVACQPLWPACWLDTPDRSSSSSSRIVQNVWDIYRMSSRWFLKGVVLALRDAVSRSAVDDFWSIWSKNAEAGLFRAYALAGGPIAAGSSAFLGRGLLRIRSRRLGGRAVGGTGSSRLYRTCQNDEVDKHCAQFFVNSSLSPVLLFRRRLKSVTDVLKGIRSKGFTQSRWDALLRYWGAVCRHGPCGPISSLHPWDSGVPPDLHGFYKWVFDSLEVLNGFLRQVVVSRRDDGIRRWSRWLREDLSSRPYAWLRPDYVPPSPFLVVKDPQIVSSRILVEQHLKEAESVFSLGNGLSSVEAWFSTALDIEEVLSGTGRDQLHVMVADVIKSFDTLDRSILDCALGRLGLAYFCFIVRFVSGLSLLLGLVSRGGCPLSRVFIVALYVPWCRHLDALPDVKPQLYVDNLKCSAERLRALFDAARFTAQYVRLVGQDVSPGKCVLLSTSKAVRRAMKLWDISGEDGFWKVQLDVRDLGGHLDFTYRARAGTLSRRVGEATVGVAAVGALPLGFQVKLGLVRGKYLPAGLHAAEASYVSSSSISAFRAAIVRAVWSS